MYRKSCRYAGRKRAKRLPYRGVRLVDPQYFTLFGFIDIVSNDGIEHRVAQAVEEPVNA